MMWMVYIDNVIVCSEYTWQAVKAGHVDGGG